MKPKMFCSFCRKSDLEVAKMVSDASGKTHICDECIKVCYAVVSEEPKPAK